MLPAMSSLLRRIASLAGRFPRLTTLAVLLAVAALAAGAIASGGAFEDDFTVPGIEAQKAQDLLDARFPAQAGAQATVVFHGELDGGALTPAIERIERLPHVEAVEEPQLSADGRTAFTTVTYDRPADELGGESREELETATEGAGVQVELAGEVIDGSSTGGFPIGEVAGLAIAVLLLIVVLRSLRAAGNALLAAFAGIGLGFGILLWASTVTEIPGLAPTLAGMLGLGAGIDYALLLSARQQEELRAGHPPLEAARRANATAGHSALTAAGIVLVSIAGLIVTGIPFVGRAGVAAGVVVLACALTCVILLPARFARLGVRALPRRERRARAAVGEAPRRELPRAPRRPAARRSPPAGRGSRCRPPGSSRSRSPRPPPASSSASRTTATSAATRPSAARTTCSPTASARASTARWSCRSRCRRAATAPRSSGSSAASRATPASARSRPRCSTPSGTPR